MMEGAVVRRPRCHAGPLALSCLHPLDERGMSDDALAFAPAWQLRDLVARREVSPVALAELFLRRISALNPRLNAYLTVAADQALAAARHAELAVARREPLGPLHGVPIAIKDLNSTQGIRTTRGSLLYKDYVPPSDDLCVARIRAAGAVILGKTNTPEFGHSGTTENLLGDACRNPWDLTRTSGGSSGGAASGLAAGLHPIAQGSDGGGSIRMPASMCGVYGLKPAQGRVARSYVAPGGWNVFAQNGPITRTVRDAALLLQVMAGPDPFDPTAIPEPPPDFSARLDAGVRGMRIGLSVDMGGVPVDPQVCDSVRKAALAFEALGASVEESRQVGIDHEQAKQTFVTLWLADYALTLGDAVSQHGDAVTPWLRELVLEAMAWPASYVARALHDLEWHRYRMDALVRRYDLLLTPTLAVPAFPVGRRPSVIDGQVVDSNWGFTPFTYLVNMSGHPAASIPCGFTTDGLPIGLHLIGHRNDEATVLQASAAFEAARPWAHKRPTER